MMMLSHYSRFVRVALNPHDVRRHDDGRGCYYDDCTMMWMMMKLQRMPPHEGVVPLDGNNNDVFVKSHAKKKRAFVVVVAVSNQAYTLWHVTVVVNHNNSSSEEQESHNSKPRTSTSTSTADQQTDHSEIMRTTGDGMMPSTQRR
jgi:hypothetical protein